MFKLKRILNSSLCLGCGLCESISGGRNVMKVQPNGFIAPDYNSCFSKEEYKVLDRLCPAVNIQCTKKTSSEFGEIKYAVEGWANNNQIRYAGSSGGTITAICSALIQSKEVDAILQVGKVNNHYMYNELKVSLTTNDVYLCASSRYAPVSMFKNIFHILDTDLSRTFAFVGKPCDVMTMRRIISENPQYYNRIKYLISIACAGTPSYSATELLIKMGSPNIKPVNVRYRGHGWPGDFKVDYEDGSEFRCNYTQSWGEVLGRNLNFRCKICPDGLGNFADIVVGDSWHTKNGYPDFTERDGKSFILVRTQNGTNLLKLANLTGAISTTPLSVNSLKEIHPYQYQRLQTASYKLIAAWMCTRGLIKVRELRIPTISLYRGLRTMIGTIKRF